MLEWLVLIFLLVTPLLLLSLTLSRKYIQLKSKIKSQAAKYGKISEQFMPFIKDYPYNPENFRFIGTPIDGIQFEKDRIIFMEFKTSNSSLSKKQRNIKRLIEKKKVEWKEYKLR